LPEGQRLTIWDTRNDLALCAQDLGVGISQVVPVLVAALHNIQGIVAIEEPESNIHPAFQVVLADLFITQAKANPDVLFLVETHSEHLMLRCLRRIRETTKGLSQTGDVPSVTPEEVAVHFVEPCADGPRIHRIEIDGEGDFLDPWPQGFFRERVKELYGDDL
jgi:predicted ATPase